EDGIRGGHVTGVQTCALPIWGAGRHLLDAVPSPMHMIAPIIEGTLNVVCVRNSIQQMPASAPGKAVMMMNGSSHDWKFTTINRRSEERRVGQEEGQEGCAGEC